MSLFIIIAVIALVIIAGYALKKKFDRRKLRRSILIEKQEKDRARMADLREKKEKKRLERIAQEEQRKKEEEELAEKQKKERDKLGLIESESEEQEDYIDGYGYTTLEYQTNEDMDVDKLLQYVRKYSLEDESIKVWINASSGNSMYFAFNEFENVRFARIGEGVVKKFQSKKALRNFVWCFCQNEQILAKNKRLESILASGIDSAAKLQSRQVSVEDNLADILMKSDYSGLFKKHLSVLCENNIALIEYDLPAREDLTWVKEYKYVTASNTIKETPMAESAIAKSYEQLLYSICLRSVYEVCVAQKAEDITSVVFNGFVTAINRANGIKERKCILSMQVSKERFLSLDLRNVDPKKCFKSLKGVSAAQLIDISPVQPVLSFNRNDRRFVESKDIQMNSGTNLASMDWEDFEHLVRELFEMEFSRNGGEVRVTQASRDGGVDAVVFDPDPLRGGKIVIQAKRYTNTVGVSAVRDLYGTVINEGANSGILITTSDYGHDSYEFAKDKPLKLLNGGHLLALLHKNGKKGYINIQEAKKILKED